MLVLFFVNFSFIYFYSLSLCRGTYISSDALGTFGIYVVYPSWLPHGECIIILILHKWNLGYREVK